jgi:hypothetical protein
MYFWIGLPIIENVSVLMRYSSWASEHLLEQISSFAHRL